MKGWWSFLWGNSIKEVFPADLAEGAEIKYRFMPSAYIMFATDHTEEMQHLSVQICVICGKKNMYLVFCAFCGKHKH